MGYSVAINGQLTDISLTSNMRPMLDHVFGGYWLDIMGQAQTWGELENVLTVASATIAAMDGIELDSWDAPNGWGMGVDTMAFVDALLERVRWLRGVWGSQAPHSLRVFA